MTDMTTFLLRHYGPNPYDPSLFKPIQDWRWFKPKGGLWTSPAKSIHGWAKWCHDTDYRDPTSHFDVRFAGNVLTIDSVADLDQLTWQDHELGYPLFEPLVKRGIDAIHLTVRGESATRYSHPYNLYGWDCETVLVMNRDCLTPIGTERRRNVRHRAKGQINDLVTKG